MKRQRRRCWRKPVHFVCSLCGVLVVVLNRRKLACVLVGVFVLVFSSCCYEVYLADRSLSNVCTDEEKCTRRSTNGEESAVQKVFIEKSTRTNQAATNVPLKEFLDKSFPELSSEKIIDNSHVIAKDEVQKPIPIVETPEIKPSSPKPIVRPPDRTDGVQSLEDRYEHRNTPTVSNIKSVPHPKILWWDFYSHGYGKDINVTCKQNVQCHVVSHRNFTDHPDTKAIIHYGTHMDFLDLPRTRNPDMVWALIHEESMKNADYLFNHEEMLSLFNYTCTFRRESDYPVTTNFLDSLDDLQSKEFLVPVEEKNRLKQKEGLAPLFYIHSDCGVPSNRDKYVELLQKYIAVDSYGRCNNNKKLPNHLTFEKSMQPMLDKEFFQLAAKYKFALTMENSVCNDYITEKVWRPLILGSVPVIFGSPKIKDFLPSAKSAIIINDFNITDLAALLHYLDKNDTAYNEYLQFKEPGGITNKYLVNKMKSRDWDRKGKGGKSFYSFFSGFECFICEKIHEIEKARRKGETFSKVATLDHYGCPAPKMFDNMGRYSVMDKRFSYYWYEGKYKAKAFRYFYDNHLNFTYSSIEKLAESYRVKDSIK